MLTHITLSLSIIFLSTGFGFFLQEVEKKMVKFPIPTPKLKIILQKIAFLFFMPISIIAAIWELNFENSIIITLPLINIFSVFFGLVFSFAIASHLKLTKLEKGSFIACGSFSNAGAIGGLICYIFWGEEGFAMVPFYNFCMQGIFLALCVSIGKYYGNAKKSTKSINKQFIKGLTDIFFWVALTSTFSGLILNLSQVVRPSFFQYITKIFVPVGTSLMLISIGLEIQLSKIKCYLRECIIISLIKFIFVPACTVLIAVKLGYGHISDGLPLKLVIILASMPVAFTPLIAVSLYGLDSNLANSVWIFSNIALIVVVPVLFFIVHIF